MRLIRTAALVVVGIVAVLFIARELAADTWVLSKLPIVGSSPAMQFAQALCTGDAGYLAAHSAGNMEITAEEAARVVARRAQTDSRCTGVVYLRPLNGGTQELFILTWTRGGRAREITYLFTLQADGRVIDLE